ncbi:MAG: TonB-dependent receptor plug domain-containing protein, partial [Sphingobacteriaceae bacterium]
MKISISTIVFVLTVLLVNGQEVADTAGLKEVVIKAYFSDHSLLDVPASVSVINPQVLQSQPPKSLLPAINTAPGVRMEERSPGSYRLSIRGSLLRSPFGIRNVKIYLDDFLLTDAGGNTYLNV